MGHEPHMLPGVRKNVRENTAGNPFVFMKLFHGKTGESRSLLECKRHNLAPLLPYGELRSAAGLPDSVEEYIQTAIEESYVIAVKVGDMHVRGKF